MATVPLYSIDRACKSRGGVESLFIYNSENIASIPIVEPGGIIDSGLTFTDPALVYYLEFTRRTCQYSFQGKDSRAGQYFDEKIEAVISRRRLEVELIIKRLIDKRINVVYTDANGLQYHGQRMKFSADYETGKSKPEVNGYTLKFEGASDMGRHILDGATIAATTGQAITLNSSGGCAKINPTPIGFTPTATGNASNFCEFVLDPAGRRWFIDGDGDAINLNQTAADMTITDSARGNVLTAPDGSMWRIYMTNSGLLETEAIS